MGCALKMGEGPARQVGQAAPGSRKGKEMDPPESSLVRLALPPP